MPHLSNFSFFNSQVFEPKESKSDDNKGKKEIPPTLIRSCQQIVNGLVNSIMELEKSNGARLVGCVTALHSFAQIRPQLLVEHTISMEPYLNIKCSSNEQIKFISLLAEILEHVSWSGKCCSTREVNNFAFSLRLYL